MQELYYYWQKRTESAAIITHASFQRMPHHPLLHLAARREFYEGDTDTGLHKHEDFYALYIVQGGQGIHLINNHPYGIARGDIYMLPPGSIHAYRDYHSLVIDAFYFLAELFSDEELHALHSLSGLWNLLIAINEETQEDIPQDKSFNDHRLHLPPIHFHEVEAMIGELHTEFISSAIEAPLLTRNLFFRLLVHLARWQAAQQATHNTDKRGTSSETRPMTSYKISIAHVLQICEERFYEPLTVPQLAALMFLSPSRFSELFSREVGMSPATYIRRLRLERAQLLLRTTSLSTTTIAHQVGFRDSAQLSRAFHSAFQFTPSTYRARFRQYV
jgi:AraC-like DNA-binding protein/mannose-6-phosphate isomerase-like protein (cupin superfamily)